MRTSALMASRPTMRTYFQSVATPPVGRAFGEPPAAAAASSSAEDVTKHASRTAAEVRDRVDQILAHMSHDEALAACRTMEGNLRLLREGILNHLRESHS